MKIPNQLLPRLTPGFSGSILEAGDGELEIPNVITPVVSLYEPLKRGNWGVQGTFAGTAANLVDSSTFVYDNSTNNNAIYNKYVGFKKGLWKFYVTLDMIANVSVFTGPVTFNILDPAANAIQILMGIPILNVQYSRFIDFSVFFPEDNFAFQVTQTNLGAGNQSIINWSVIANKKL